MNRKEDLIDDEKEKLDFEVDAEWMRFLTKAANLLSLPQRLAGYDGEGGPASEAKKLADDYRHCSGRSGQRGTDGRMK